MEWFLGDYSNLVYLVFGWILGQIGRWIQYRKETPIELRKRPWEKKKTFRTLPRAWDAVFSKDRHYWLKIILKDGTKIGGYYGPNSFTSNYPHEDDIYIEDVWNLDEGETYEKHVPKGLLVERKEISHIEVYQVEIEKGGEER
jgi:hypothetical protein